MNPDPITVPFREGMKARAAGKTMSENPYPHSREYGKDWYRGEWQEGWYQEDEARDSQNELPDWQQSNRRII